MKERGRKWLHIVAIAMILAIASTIIIQHNNTPRDYPQIATHGVLNVGMYHSPLSYNIINDSITGYDYELLQMLKRLSGWDVKLHHETSMSRCMQKLNNRTYDVVACQTPITSYNTHKYLFSKPLSLNKQVLIQRTDSTGNVSIRNQLDLQGCTLHIVQDSPTRLRIENLAQETGNTIHICETHNHNCDSLVRLVATGAIDYAVCDEVNAAMIAANYDNINYDTAIGFTQFMSWVMRPESTILCDSLNRWISVIQQSDEYRELYTQYFGTKNFEKLQRIGQRAQGEKRDTTHTETVNHSYE